MKKIIIAIDGSSSCGKSTLAKSLAQKLGYKFIDSGAMYRVITLFFQRHHIEHNDLSKIQAALDDIQISFHNINGKNTAFLNGENVESAIRTMEVSNMVSEIAAIPSIRKFAVEQQQKMGVSKGLVMDGRDIATVVFPNAELKLFVSASLEVRTERRYKELLERGFSITKEEVQENLEKRDRIDSTRADSPLRRHRDAIGIDTTNLSMDRVLVIALRLAMNVISA